MKPFATQSRSRAARQRPKDNQSQLVRWQAIASIAASIAVPLILAVVGYMVQRQIATEGLKKDYVQIAASILKENPNGQEKELRKWAVEVLDRNADIPFSSNAKASLEKGFPIVRNNFLFPDAPKPCMEPPARLKFDSLIKSSIKGEYIDIGDQKRFLLAVTDEAYKAESAIARLQCLQEWVHAIKKTTDESNSKEYGLTTSVTEDPSKNNKVQKVP